MKKKQPYKSVLVTGGAGFIGSHIVDHLVADGFTTYVIDDFSGGYQRNINPKAQSYSCDLRDQVAADALISRIKPELVYHLAANAAENKAQFSPIDISTRNYNTFINTLVPAVKHGMKRIVVTSSIAVYGAGTPPFKENDIPIPEDVYGVSKLMMESTLQILAKVHGFEYVITRPHNVYGPRQNMSDPYRNVITLFMNALLKNEPYYIYGDGEQRRCFSYIDDVAEALYKTGFLPVSGKVFNIGSDSDYSLNELSDLILQVSQKKSQPIHIAGRAQEVKVAISDHANAKKFLDYADRTTLLNGLAETWKYAQTMGPQETYYTDFELESPLIPSNWRHA